MKTKLFLLSLLLTIVGTMKLQAYTVYYYNTGNYKFAVWYWIDGVEGQYSDWMTPVSGHTGWYQTTIRDNCDMVIFASFYTSTATPDLSQVVSQTRVTYDGENAYYVEGNGWQNSFEVKISGTCGDNLTWTWDDNGTLTISGTGNMNDYDYSSPWRKYENIKTVIINAGVTSIGDYTFKGCSGLTSITIPNSVTSIGNSAFSGCSGLTSITIPNSVTSIGYSAFFGCTGLASITIPNSVTSIGETAFLRIPNIEYYGTATGSPWGARSVNGYVEGYLVYANDSKTTLLACFAAAEGIITIPNSVTSIGGEAFIGCSGLTSITIPNSVTSIGRGAFWLCSGLTSVDIPNSVTSIGESAFYNCSSLTSVTISNSVTSIGYEAFYNCSSLTSITIPHSVTSIGERAFSGCSGLKNVILGSSLKVIESYAFSNCSSIETITCYSQRPPTVKDNALNGLNYSTIVYVPADYLDTYKMHDAWGLYDVRPIESEEPSDNNYTITLEVSNQTMGTTLGGGTFAVNSLVTFAAVPYKGYQFSQWSDGNTDNPRTITVAENKTYTAQFEAIQTTSEPKVYQVNIQGDNCSMNVSNQYPEGSVITIQVIPDECLEFKQWSDGNTDNPRTITVNKDNTYTAEFNKLQYIVTGKSNSQAGGKVNIIKH